MFYALTKKLKLPRYESLYLMFSPMGLPYCCKIGISKDAKQRREQVQNSIHEIGRKVRVRYVYVPLLYAQAHEAFLHRLFKRWQYTGLKGTSGHTEWLYSPNLLTFAVVWFLGWLYNGEAPLKTAFVFLALPLPIDYFLFIVALAVFQFTLLIGAFWGAAWALNLY